MRWRKKNSWIAHLMVLALLLLVGCNNESQEDRTQQQTDTTVDTSQGIAKGPTPFKTLIDLPVDTPESLSRKTNQIISWTPTQAKYINSALRGVTRLVMFSDLGLDDQIEFVAPRTSGVEPSVQSLQLVLGDEITAVAARFILDTLPGPRVRGESEMGLMGIHGDTLFGRDVVLPRTQSSSGRFDLIFLRDYLYLQTRCCGIPGTYGIDRYGSFGDTMTVIFVFTPSIGMYTITLAGREACRTFPGFQYTVFRTERGEYHRDVGEFPYLIRSTDSTHVNMYFGKAWRGRKSVFEPVFRVRMF